MYWIGPPRLWERRLLRQWLVRPLLSYDQIRLRLDAVDELKNHMQVRVALRTALREIQDIARLGGRIVLGLAGPRELLALNSLSRFYLRFLCS